MKIHILGIAGTFMGGVAALAREFPEAKIFEVSAREGTGCEAWFEAVLAAEMNTGRFLEIDYDRYGEGEALLGWLNATVEIQCDSGVDEFDGNEMLQSLAATLRTRRAVRRDPVAENGGIALEEVMVPFVRITEAR